MQWRCLVGSAAAIHTIQYQVSHRRAPFNTVSYRVSTTMPQEIVCGGHSKIKVTRCACGGTIATTLTTQIEVCQAGMLDSASKFASPLLGDSFAWKPRTVRPAMTQMTQAHQRKKDTPTATPQKQQRTWESRTPQLHCCNVIAFVQHLRNSFCHFSAIVATCAPQQQSVIGVTSALAMEQRT